MTPLVAALLISLLVLAGTGESAPSGPEPIILSFADRLGGRSPRGAGDDTAGGGGRHGGEESAALPARAA